MVDRLELVGTDEIAKIAGVGRSAVSNWKRRYENTFPEPVALLAVGEIYLKSDIMRWLKLKNKYAELTYEI